MDSPHPAVTQLQLEVPWTHIEFVSHGLVLHGPANVVSHKLISEYTYPTSANTVLFTLWSTREHVEFTDRKLKASHLDDCKQIIPQIDDDVMFPKVQNTLPSSLWSGLIVTPQLNITKLKTTRGTKIRFIANRVHSQPDR